jgi:transposase
VGDDDMSRPQPIFTDEEKRLINEALSKPQSQSVYKRLMVIKLKAEKQMTSKNIAEILDLHAVSVNKIVSKYKKYGLQFISGNNYKQNQRYLTKVEETEFLKTFENDALAGKVLEVADIIKSYEKLIGHPVAKSTVYKLLYRNNWRKVMPRSKHPQKASNEAIEAYKKNS